MNNTLLIPMCGKSSRFPDMRPKWMLTHVSGRMMITEAIAGLDFSLFDRVLFICLQEHQNKYHFYEAFNKEVHQLINGSGRDIPIDTLFLENPTSSQAETVYHGIKANNLTGGFLIKDSDGYFKPENLSCGNNICFFNLNDLDNINARSKSYVELDSGNAVMNIVEKKVISGTFCVGGYGFKNAEEFCASYEKLAALNGGKHEIYISHVIFDMMLSGTMFTGVRTSDFKDWGTLEAWTAYKNQYKTLFVDIDGTLISNAGSHGEPFIGSGKPIQENIDAVNKLYDSGKGYIVITTSRSHQNRELTEKELAAKGIKYHVLLTGLPHCQRVVINDFAKSNQFPSAQAINLARDANNLKDYLN